MSPAELEAAARALYERNAPIAPAWDSLGTTTKDVWREDVLARAGKAPPVRQEATPAPQSSTLDLFPETVNTPRVRTRVRTA